MMLRCLPLAAFLTALAVLSPQSAWASCGDWLAHPESVEVAEPSSVIDVASDVDFRFSKAPRVPQRCRGPLCKQSPLGSFPEPTSPVSERYHHETACLSGPGHQLAILQWGLIEDAQLLLPGGVMFRIDRPPQA